MGPDWTACQNQGRTHAETATGHNGQSRKVRSKTEKNILKQKNEVLKQEIWSLFLKIFVSGHMSLS